MVPDGIAFTVSLNGTEIYTGTGDYVLGNVTTANTGDYIINAVNGCSTIISLMVSDIVCDASTMKAQWSLDGGSTYSEAIDNLPVTINATAGNNVQLSMVPDGVAFTISYNGLELYAGTTDYTLSSVTPLNAGNYTLTSIQGCSTMINLVVDCPIFTPSYVINGTSDNGQNSITVTEGNSVQLGLVENGITYTVTEPNGNISNGPLDLGSIALTQEGVYTYTSNTGCTTSLNITINELCPANSFTPSYSINGTAIDTQTSITITEGDTIALSLVQTGVTYTITDPSNTVNNGSLNITNITLNESGDYTYISDVGCTATVTITVNELCPAGSFTPQYIMDGIQGSGQSNITILEGTPISLGIVQSGINFTITDPNGTITNGNLGNITLTQAGNYIFTSEVGCTSTLNITVIELCATGGFTPQYIMDGIQGSGQSSITILEGTSASLSLVQSGIAYTITQPNGTITNGNLNLNNIALSQAGDYIYTSEVGCSSTLSITVNERCPANGFTAQYTVNDIAESGEESITVNEGTPIILGITQTGIDFTVTLPSGTVTNGPLNFGNANVNHSGEYLLTSELGCTTTLMITITPLTTTNTTALKDILVYPNPVRDGNIKFLLDGFMDESMQISFYNIYGKLVAKEMVLKNHDAEVIIDVSILSEGTYIVEISRNKNNENTFKKVIKFK